MLPELALQKVLDKLVDNKKVFGTSFAIKKNGDFWQGTSGNILKDESFFIASTTKLFTTALVLQLNTEKRLNFSDKIAQYLDQTILEGLHVFKGKAYAQEITIEHLLAHTSGLPDYFQDKNQNNSSLESDIKLGKDQSWSFDEIIERNKLQSPLFIPGSPKKAHYSDTNFQLLGKIIEVISGKSYTENCNARIIHPLGLSQTYLYHDINDGKPKQLYYNNSVLHIPKAMTSFGPDGGMVSNTADLLIFIEAFFTGKLFSMTELEKLNKWKKIFLPMQAGIGIHRFKLPWFFDPFGAVPEFIGHSGLSGALAFYCPSKNIFIAGTVNQVAHPDLSFRTMIKLIQKIK